MNETRPVYSFTNADDALYVYQDRIVIKRRSTMVNRMAHKVGEKTFFYPDITSIQFKKYTFLAGGYIQFSVKGDGDDENTMQIGGSQNNATAENVYNYVTSKIKETRSNAVTIKAKKYPNVDVPIIKKTISTASEEEGRYHAKKEAELATQKRLVAEKRLAEEKKNAAEAERTAHEEARKAIDAETELTKAQAQLAKERRLAKKQEEVQRRKEDNKILAEQAKDRAKDIAQKTGKSAIKASKIGIRLVLIVLAILFFLAAAILAISKFAFQAIDGLGVVIAIIILAVIGGWFLKLSNTQKLK